MEQTPPQGLGPGPHPTESTGKKKRGQTSRGNACRVCAPMVEGSASAAVRRANIAVGAEAGCVRPVQPQSPMWPAYLHPWAWDGRPTSGVPGVPGVSPSCQTKHKDGPSHNLGGGGTQQGGGSKQCKMGNIRCQTRSWPWNGCYRGSLGLYFRSQVISLDWPPNLEIF